MSGFKDGLDKIADGVKDITELNVRTFTGSITAQVQAKNTAQLLSAPGAGQLELVGITTMKLDGDVDQFISNSQSVDPSLHVAHSRAVDSGQASRQAVFSLFGNAIRKALDKL